MPLRTVGPLIGALQAIEKSAGDENGKVFGVIAG
jgi:hypothetical protein